jgi:hypothetical protein
MANSAEYRQSYNSFSGVDMAVVVDNKLLGEIQGLSYTVTREKAPMYTMGSADPRSFSRGKRGIAGSMIFLVFDRNALLDTLKDSANYVANAYEVPSGINEEEAFENGAVGGAVAPVDNVTIFRGGGAGSTSAVSTTTSDVGYGWPTTDKVIARARYHDQILPFSVVLTAANEYGHIARMIIRGVEIMNCGTGLSIDDINTDESCTFVATSVVPWHRQLYVNPRDGANATVSRSSTVGRPSPSDGGPV